MRQIANYITEALHLNKDSGKKYTCCPKDQDELRSIIKERLEKNKDADLNDIDVSEIDDMSNLFSDLDPHNIDISKWNVSNVKWMNAMFMGCKNFNCDISNWNVSNVEYMNFMFYGCYEFNCNLSEWDVSMVRKWNGIFGPYDGMHEFKKEYKPKFKLKK